MTQTGLGQAIGLTFQQVQKYERGVNRIGSSRLYDLARVLDVPVNFFFDEMPKDVASKSNAASSGPPEGAEAFDPDIVSKRETLELVRAYYKIDNPQVRKRLFELVKVLGKSA
jgi:transcriptional regulator with XRE-family HTH domain